MKRTLDIKTVPGVAVHFPCNFNGNVCNENLFVVELFHPEAQDGSIKYRSVKHIFTEKELNRAAVRYYSDCNLIVDEQPASEVTQHRNQLVGYVGIRNYVNRNSVLTTRFITQMKTSEVPVLGVDKCVLLFTAREMQRSADRISWLEQQLNPSLWERVKRFFYG